MTEFVSRARILTQKVSLLNSLKGKIITKMIRYCWCAPQELVTTFDVKPSEVFSLDEGAILIHLDSGAQIAFHSEQSKNSVVVWIEKNKNGFTSNEPMEKDLDFYPIDALDLNYSNEQWGKIIGKKIVDMQIIKRTPENSKYEELPNEVALLVIMETKDKFLLAHGLHNNSGDFAIITVDQIHPNVLPQLIGFK